MSTYLVTGGAGFISSNILLGYHPEVSFEEGLRRTIKDFHP